MAHIGRNIVMGAVAAVVVGGLVFVTVRPDPIPADLYTIEMGTMTVTVDVDGETRVKEVFDIAAPIAGVARRSPVRVGDRVIAGETVVANVEPVAPALLDARSLMQAEAAVRESEATLQMVETDHARAAQDLTYAQGQYDRAAELVERGVASITRLEDEHQRLAVAKAVEEAAAARIVQARSSVDRARAMLSSGPVTGSEDQGCCVAILAPVNGVVLSIDTVSERPVQAGTRLLSIGDPSNLEIVADLLSSDAVRLPEKAVASVERWGGQPLQAQLVRVEPAARTKVSALGIEEQRVDAVFDLVSPAEDRTALGHEFAVFLRIVEYEEANTLLVPLSAAFRTDEGWAVFRTTGDRVEQTPIEIGRNNGRFAAVRDGLEAGDRVVQHPSEELSDGALYVERSTFQR